MEDLLRTRIGMIGLASLMALAMAQAAPAQVLYGSIIGNVKDPTGAVIPGADVTITQKETNQSRSAATDDIGSYSFPAVPTGTSGPNTPRFNNPGANRSSMGTNADGTINLGGYTEITSSGSERQFRFGLRVGF